MARINYEIGARGTAEQVETFVERLRKFGDYRHGRYGKQTMRSLQRRLFLEEPQTVSGFVEQLHAWARHWSEDCPGTEIFVTLTEYGKEGVYYGSYRLGSVVAGAKIVSHDSFVEALEECDCTMRTTFFERYPTDAPFADCPVRANPPTQWAVANIMDAHEMIGMRR